MKCYRFNRKCDIKEGIEIIETDPKNKKLDGFSGKLEIMNSDDSPCIDNRNVSLYIPNFKATYLFRTDISYDRLKNYYLRMLFVLPKNHKIIIPMESEIYNDENRWLRNLENNEGNLKYFEEKNKRL